MPLKTRITNPPDAPVPVRGRGSFAQAVLAGLNPGVIAAAGDYAAGDVLSNNTTNLSGEPWSVTGLARGNGDSGYITKVLVTASADTMTARVRLRMFNARPTTGTEMDDNAVFSLAVADRLKYIGKIDLPALSDAGALSETEDATLRWPFVCLPDSNTLWFVLTVVDAEPLEVAGMTVQVNFWSAWE